MELETTTISLPKLKNGIVTYSRAGGGAGSILLVATNTNASLWIWCYWEIKKTGTILGNADDDTTAIADLDGKKNIELDHIAEAVGYRQIDRGDWAER